MPGWHTQRGRLLRRSAAHEAAFCYPALLRQVFRWCARTNQARPRLALSATGLQRGPVMSAIATLGRPPRWRVGEGLPWSRPAGRGPAPARLRNVTVLSTGKRSPAKEAAVVRKRPDAYWGGFGRRRTPGSTPGPCRGSGGTPRRWSRRHRPWSGPTRPPLGRTIRDLLTSRSAVKHTACAAVGAYRGAAAGRRRQRARRGQVAGYFGAFFLRSAQEAFIRSDTASFSVAVIGRRFLVGLASDAVSATGSRGVRVRAPPGPVLARPLDGDRRSVAGHVPPDGAESAPGARISSRVSVVEASRWVGAWTPVNIW